MVVGDLAERWTVSPDGTVYTFTFRGGIRWHDGTPFTVDDVIFSLTKMNTPISGRTTTMSAYLSAVSKFEAVDARTVRIVLKERNADFLLELATDYAKIEPQHIVKVQGDMNKVAIGTGPFKLQTYRPGDVLELIRNPDYGVEPGRPYLDGIRFIFIPDRATLLAALTTGRIDTHGRSSPELLQKQEVDEVKRQNPTLQAQSVAAPSAVSMFMNTKQPPFNDVRVRKAAFLALDRQLGIRVLEPGAGALPGLFPPGWGMTQQALAQFPGLRQPKDPDLAEARRLLQEAGAGKGLPFELLSRVSPTTLEPTQFIAQQLAVVGFQPTVKPLEDAVFWQRGATGNFMGLVFTPAVALPVSSMASFIGAGGALNFTGLGGDPESVQLWNKQLATLDPDARRQLLIEIERRWYTELFGEAPLMWVSTIAVTSQRVQNFRSAVMGVAGLMCDRVWLKP